MILYKTNDDNNVINKNKEILFNLSINLPSNINILRPEIVLSGFNPIKILEVNYCYIKSLKRFYLVERIVVNGRLARMYLTVDVLETYKDQILNSRGLVSKNISDNDFNPIKNFNSSGLTNVKEVSFPNDLMNGKSLILLTIGGGKNG